MNLDLKSDVVKAKLKKKKGTIKKKKKLK